ncbi:uncharacterized protein Z518_02957 [Rhinocladiella mackenziei CBS 650.93]|uniref:Uncharacterized protein n=1 Tax=Rhinocladiella mackenziei CBS 650.93 TaxID=1442369 RepID=A0A0D2IY16_9EURO|nr:uncharacterized protein Z518_02957 [Rhinocladiella mackenziei CBS 650.93]KIX08301.1 hypothetical protein Z518_02957 [Rhinocladiella mackenziei CBS 650.93]
MNYITTQYAHALELLEDLVKQDPPVQTDLVVCSTKEEFLTQILPLLHAQSDELRQPSRHPEDGDGSETDETRPSGAGHIFLAQPLHLLHASRFIKLVFTPTITALHGYLAVHKPKPASFYPTSSSSDGQLVILNLLNLHHGTSEFTLQGLSQTFATAVSAAHRTNQQLRLVECRDISDPSNPNRGSALWRAEVPLLNASIKIGDGGAAWGRRTISAMKVASRWFNVQRRIQRDKESEDISYCHEIADSEDEMLI